LRPPTVQSQNPHLLLQKRDVFSHVGPEAPNHSSYPHFNWNRKDNSQQLTWRPPSWSQTRQKEAPKQWGDPLEPHLRRHCSDGRSPWFILRQATDELEAANAMHHTNGTQILTSILWGRHI
jgi:hypothetical protein